VRNRTHNATIHLKSIAELAAQHDKRPTNAPIRPFSRQVETMQMGPNADVLPRTDADFNAFAANFAAGWVPATFGVTAPLAATITTQSGDFTTALNAATDNSTRTPVTVATKDAQRALLSNTLRDAIRSATAAYRSGVVGATAQALLALNIRPPKLTRTPISQPIYPPVLQIAGLAIGTTELRVVQVDQQTGQEVTARQFAYGISGVELQRKAGAGEWEIVQSRKRAKLSVSTAGIVLGTALLFRARYVTAKGLSSPWSLQAQCVAT
jgi:hypothetical protein